MAKLVVKVKKLNKRRIIPNYLPDAENIVGVVFENFAFEGEEVAEVPNPALGKWFKDGNNHFYWGGALHIFEEEVDEQAAVFEAPDNILMESNLITPVVKRKIEQVINAFETGTAEGNYATLVTLDDYKDPDTGTRIKQVTFGRSQTTEFSHLRALVQDYIDSNGQYAADFTPFVGRIGKKPSLATNDVFCSALKKAGKNDPIMRVCQDRLFDNKYFLPAYNWFAQNGFRLPLSLLVIYDSFIHSGGILPFLRRKFATNVPVQGGAEKEWITNYVNARHYWLSNHSSKLLRNTNYRTACFKEQIQNNNWWLHESFKAHGVKIV